ncbi:MAG TPA: AraC family transcriptional regulator [Steroidobacteraceae bacterium]|jgi:AraC family transcriptional regulator|nr:AraC family transcriptional regulator [Steroidobacteraceae bacterium]
MSAPKSRAMYADRMQRVTEYIDRHLDRPLDLDTLAAVAHFSPYHFHRLFSAWMGETLGDYLRRRRCEIAATRLVAQPRVAVLQLALAVGFGSAEAFAHAFKSRFGVSPTSWRQQQSALRSAKRNSSQINRKPDQDQQEKSGKNAAVHHPGAEAPMKVEIVERKPTNIVCLRYVGPYGEPISAFWQQTVYPWMAASGLLQQPRYGVSYDDPNVVDPAQCRYDAGCEAPATLTALGNAQKTTIQGGKYAAFSFKGTVNQIEEAWTAMLRDWLPASGLQLDGRPVFEYYPEGTSYDPKTGVFDCKLCIPVVPL